MSEVTTLYIACKPVIRTVNGESAISESKIIRKVSDTTTDTRTTINIVRNPQTKLVTQVEIGEDGKQIESIIGLTQTYGADQPLGLQTYNGTVDKNYNGQADKDEPKVMVGINPKGFETNYSLGVAQLMQLQTLWVKEGK